MTSVITIRPEVGAATTIERGKIEGMDIRAFPMTEIRPLDWKAPDPASVDALLIGSMNAIMHGGEELEGLAGKPAFAVGEVTADAARRAGFDVRQVGQGGMQQLLAQMPEGNLRMLRIAARKHVDIRLPEGVSVETRIAYEAVDLPMPAELASILRSEDVLVLLHAAGSAQHFAVECDRQEIGRSSIALAALGPRIALAAGTGWKDLRAAPRPRESALLALAADMCH